MILIVSEKPIAGERITAILSDGKFQTQGSGRAVFFVFEKSGQQFTTVPLKGHVRDVDFPVQYQSWIGTDLKQLANAKINYIDTEKEIVELLKKVAPSAEKIIIATDADREGESIGLEALNAVKSVNPKIKVERAIFSAITPKDINPAFEKPVAFDYNLADSADARREIDLVWGAALTRFLSIVSGKLGKEFLSAGRVQMPTLKLIVDREKERTAFLIKPFWELQAIFRKGTEQFPAEHKKGRFWNKEEAEKAFDCQKPPIGIVLSVEKKHRIISKPIPFNTTGFLRSATAIGFSASQAMSIAESLYQAGFISYPRTDNSVYPASLDIRATLAELGKVKEFSKDTEKLLAMKQIVPSRGKEAKDHPPVHPVAAAKKDFLALQQWKIYELVCRHFFATLAEDAETENMLVEIDLNKQPFVAHGQIFTKLGWKEFYRYSKATEVELPKLEKGDKLDLVKLDLLEKATEPPARYSQGALIKLMSDLNLGTKATRAEIIQKLYARQYISGQKAIVPNRIAFAVIDSLEKYGEKVVKPEMTSDLEKEMDIVAAGSRQKESVVEESRGFLLGILDELLKNRANIGSLIRDAARSDSIVGKCGKGGCEGNLIIRHGRTGKRFLGCTKYPQCTNTFPLPQKGKIIPTEKKCPDCGNIVIQVAGGRRRFEMCIDMNCKSKDAWKKASLEKAAKKEADEKAKAAEVIPAEKAIEKPVKEKKRQLKKPAKKPKKEKNKPQKI
ncbi:MAG: DNA topoisomerase I [Candidatus ainarchaeum sp.]|nr:DNA topoisomerase I [Candidatus ainarchaeum sp.]